MDFPKRKRRIGGPASMAHSPSHFVVMGPNQQIPTSSVTADLSNVVGAPCSEKICRAPPEMSTAAVAARKPKDCTNVRTSSSDQLALAANPQMINRICLPVPKRRLETQISGAAMNGNYKKLGKQFGLMSPRADDAPLADQSRPPNLDLTSRDTCLISYQDCTITTPT
jgi:hypothetical protein